MIPGIPLLIEGISGKFLPFHQKIVAPRLLRRDPKPSQRPQDHLQLPGNVIILFSDHKGKIKIPQVMEDRSPAGKAAGQFPARLLKFFRPALGPGVLIAPDHHRLLVLPQIEDTYTPPAGFQEQFLQRQILIRIKGITLQEEQLPDHACPSSPETASKSYRSTGCLAAFTSSSRVTGVVTGA